MIWKRRQTTDIDTLYARAGGMGLRVEEDCLPRGMNGYYCDALGLIVLHDKLNARQRRCTLCHELIHARHHDHGCGTRYGAKCERRCRRETALALEGSLGCIRWQRWGAVLLGLVLSVAAGLWAGRQTERLTRRWPLSPKLFRLCQIPGAAGTAFFHGAQDGQKFIGVFLLGSALAQGRQETQILRVPLWLMVLCAAAMAAGTALGGRRIIDTVCREMVSLGPREGFSADLAGILCLLAATLLGLPVSTTHTRTAALLGVGAAGPRGVDRRVVRSVLLAWLATFPGCMALGYVLARAALARWS